MSLIDSLRMIAGETGKSLPKVGLATGLAGVRLGTDMAQGMSGLVDLVTPGKGKSRVSRGLGNFARNIDETAVSNGVNPAYRIMQAALTPASYFGPGAITKAAGVAPKLTTAIPKITEAASSLSNGNRAQRILRATLPGIHPSNIVNAGYGTMTDIGRMSADGEQITPASGGLAAALNIATPLALPAAAQTTGEAAKLAPSAARAGLQAGARLLNVNPHPLIPKAEMMAAQKFQNVRMGTGDSMRLTDGHAALYDAFLKRIGTREPGVVDKFLREQTNYENTKIRRSGNTAEALKTAKQAVRPKKPNR